MPIVSINEQDLVNSLSNALNNCLNPHTNYIHLQIGRIGRSSKMTAHIYFDEHPPPHFHVKFGGKDACFDIMTGELINGELGRETLHREVSNWWKSNECRIKTVWNSTRPNGCQVGLVPVPKPKS